MSSCVQPLRGFKTTCSVVCVIYILLGGSMLARGAAASVRQFGVPEPVLSSPYFADCFHFLFVHMITLGALIGMLGWFSAEARQQRSAARVLCALNLHYLYLDLRTSDSPLGSALYHGAASLMPAVIDVLVLLAFGYLGLRALPAR